MSPKTGLIENKYIPLALSPVTRCDLEAPDNSSRERSEAAKKEGTCIDREPGKLKIAPTAAASQSSRATTFGNQELGEKMSPGLRSRDSW